MNKTLMIQLSLLGLALVAMLMGILLQKPLVAVQDPKLDLMILEYGSDEQKGTEDGQILDTGDEVLLNQTETSFDQ